MQNLITRYERNNNNNKTRCRAWTAEGNSRNEASWMNMPGCRHGDDLPRQVNRTFVSCQGLSSEEPRFSEYIISGVAPAVYPILLPFML